MLTMPRGRSDPERQKSRHVRTRWLRLTLLDGLPLGILICQSRYFTFDFALDESGENLNRGQTLDGYARTCVRAYSRVHKRVEIQ